MTAVFALYSSFLDLALHGYRDTTTFFLISGTIGERLISLAEHAVCWETADGT